MRLALATALFAFLAPAAWAGETGGVEAKAAYERALETRLDGLLDAALGPRRARAVVEAKLDQSVTEEMVESRAKDSDPRALPGFRRPPTAKRLSPSDDPVKHLSVRLLVDSSLNEIDVSAAKSLVEDALPLGAGRLEISFAREPIGDSWEKAMRRPAFQFRLAGLALLLSLIGFSIWLALQARSGTSRALQEVSGMLAAVRDTASGLAPILSRLATPPPVPGPPPSPPIVETAPAEAAPKPPPELELDLGSVAGKDLRLTARFLQAREPQAARLILSDMEPDTAATLFRLLPEATRGGAACELAKAEEGAVPTREERCKLAAELAAFLEKEARGPSKLVELLVRAPEAMQKSVLESVRLQAPAAAAQVKAGLLRFEDLERADLASLALLAREVTSEELGVALRGAEAALRERLLSVLPPVLRDSAARRAAQAAAPADENEVHCVRARILTRWKYLEAAGKVVPL